MKNQGSRESKLSSPEKKWLTKYINFLVQSNKKEKRKLWQWNHLITHETILLEISNTFKQRFVSYMHALIDDYYENKIFTLETTHSPKEPDTIK